MQLAPRGASFATKIVLGLAALASARAARADDVTWRGSTEVAAYQDSVAVSVLTPSMGVSAESPTAGWRVNGRYLVDVVSAASPDIVATASPNFKEVRHAGNVGFKYKPDTFGVSGGANASYTPDYLALGAFAQLTEEVDEKNLTLVEGYAYGHDTIGRTGTPFSVFSRTLQYHTLTLAFSRVVNKGLVASLGTDIVYETGDQSKPYRYVPMFSPDVAARIPRGASVDDVAKLRVQARPLEALPLDRERYAVTGRIAWRLESTTIRLDERLYTDTWGLHASTSDARILFDTSERVTIWPHLRGHFQTGVDFWQRAYAITAVTDLPRFRTGDRQLGPLMNLGLGGGLRLGLGKEGAVDDWVLTTTVDGTWTRFQDALYVSERFAALVATGLEVVF
jgi:hypothetical protein